MKRSGRALCGSVGLFLWIGGLLYGGTYGGGSGTLADPYRIYEPAHLVELANTQADWGVMPRKFFSLEADLDMFGVEMTSIGHLYDAFYGIFQGNHHTILNLTINEPGRDAVGLFGCVGGDWTSSWGAYIGNLHVKNVTVTGGRLTGGIVGLLGSGGLIRCSSSGSVTANESRFMPGSWAGGLTGGIGYNAILRGCRSSCAVSAPRIIYYSHAGGLTGECNGQIENCCATGPVTADFAGGFVGSVLSSSQITACYSTGAVSGSSGFPTGGFVGQANSSAVFSACFWDTERSGQTAAVGYDGCPFPEIRGRTTAQMQTAATFTDHGWDFVGETENWTSDAWRLCADGVSTPRPAWEFGIDGDFACPDGVGFSDLAALAASWLTAKDEAGFCFACDAVGDGWINLEDFAVLSGNWRSASSYGPRLAVYGSPLMLSGLAWSAEPAVGTVTIINTGYAAVNWQAGSTVLPNWLSIEPSQGSLEPDEAAVLTVTADLSMLYAGVHNTHFFILVVGAPDSPQAVEVRVNALTDEPTAYWAMDETQGTLAHDGSGNGHDGTLVNTPPYGVWVSGRYGRAMQFDGIDDHVRAEGFKGITGSGARTCTFWVKTEDPLCDFLSWGRMFDEGGAALNGQRWQIVCYNGELGVVVTGGNVVCSAPELTDGQWHHVAVTLDDFDDDGAVNINEGRLYVDGVLKPVSRSLPREVNTAAINDVHLGMYPEGAAQYFGGLLDEVRIYDRALSSTEILNMVSDGLQVWYKMDAGLQDSSLFDRRGTLTVGSAAAAWRTEGKLGGSLLLDGADEYAVVDGYQGVTGPQPRTVCAWIKRPVRYHQHTTESILSYGSRDRQAAGGRWDFQVTGEGALQVSVGAASATLQRNLIDGCWHHVAAVLSNDEGWANVDDIKLYVDGQSWNNIYVNPGYPVNTPAQELVHVGAASFDGGATLERFFDGQIDDLRIFDRALSAQEVLTAASAGLEGHWRFDETYEQLAHDSSVYGRHGTVLYMNPLGWASGRIDGALAFDGLDDFISVDGYSGVTGTGHRATCAWVKLPSGTEGRAHPILFHGNFDNAPAGSRWDFRITPEGYPAVLVAGASATAAVNVADGHWHHVAAATNSAGPPQAAAIRFYVDGVLASTTHVNPSQPLNTNGEVLQIGKAGYHGSGDEVYFKGLLDDVRVYRGLLDEQAIERIIALAPEAHWRLDEGAGLTATDSSGLGHDGAMVNMDASDRVAGRLGGALDFDGVNDHIVVPGYNGVTGQQPRTVCAWVKLPPNFVGSGPAILSYGSSDGGSDGSRWDFRLLSDGSPAVMALGGYAYTPFTVADGTWHHVAAVLYREGTPRVGDIQFYKDGLPMPLLTVNPTLVIDTPAGESVHLGARSMFGGTSLIGLYKGQVDDVRVYGSALSVEEIKRLAHTDNQF